MKNFLKKAAVLFIAGIYVISLMSVFAADVPSTYKIPKPADYSASEAADDIEAIVNAKSVVACNADNGVLSVDGAAVAAKDAEAKNEIKGYTDALNAKGLNLTRELVNVVTVKPSGLSLSNFAEITITSENLEKLAGVSAVRILLENENEYIVISKQNVADILAKYGQLRIQIKRISDTYTLRFLAADSTIIEKYATDIKFAIPAEHSEQTIYLFANNNQENWGGQYNPVEKTMEFLTKYSGEYNVASPDINISDISGLTEYEQKAIRFMVVRGYFELEDGKFAPGEKLTRYSFAESLVRMYFALDNDAKCTFPDVNKKYYRYIAASQQSNIVEGFGDGTFRGDENVTVEQVLALTSRTINNKNGYVYPENIEKYISDFKTSNIISDWAKKEVALSIREGIYSRDMNLTFKDSIARKDAAVILYRLFMIMNNTPEPTEVIEYDALGTTEHQTFWTMQNAIIVCSAVAVLDIIAAIVALVLVKKKKAAQK